MDSFVDNLVTVRELCRRRTWPTEAGLRWLIFNREENGLAKHIYKVGRRVLIDEAGFQEWLRAHRQAPTGS
jgi:hypothetical protein